MSVDSFKFLPRSFRPMFEALTADVDGPVWAPLTKPLSEATVAVLSSAGIFLPDTQETFDLDRERGQPKWGDPGWRVIPRDVPQHRIDAAHLHINTDPLKRDVGVAMGLDALTTLEREVVIGRLAADNYSVMGFQEEGCRVWRTRTGPEIVESLRHHEVDGLLMAPA